MTCCAPGAELGFAAGAGLPSDDELRTFSKKLGDDAFQVELSVPAVHCGACIHTVEAALTKLEHVTNARVNLSTKRVSVRWRGDAVPPIVATLSQIGYPPFIFEDSDSKDTKFIELLRAVAVAGFAAGNIMLLSVSIWSGAEGATRDLFHWISALIALPAFAFAGSIYYRSAWSALRHGRMNMDVPIAIGVTLAYAMSLYETITHGEHAYFDAAVSLLFFLLIGRTLDHFMRNKARAAVLGLSRLAPRGAIVVDENGERAYRPIAEIGPGSRIVVAAGERIPVDGCVREGSSDIDCAMVTGESEPTAARPGTVVRAGTLNLTGPLTLEATATAGDSFLAEMTRMMEAAEGGRARYRRIADKVSALYAPVVHLTALLTFVGWMIADGDWHKAMTIAIAVLIITCPCALGLAVPVVQVVAARRLFESGVMVKDGSAMERLAEVDTVVFDKTGTLTLGTPTLLNANEIKPGYIDLAAGLAVHSRHPLSKAIAASLKGPVLITPFEDIHEIPGQGIEARHASSMFRLGRFAWAVETAPEKHEAGTTVLSCDGMLLASFRFADVIRPDAGGAVATIQQTGSAVEMLSGDAPAACRSVAQMLGIAKLSAGLLPSEKVARIAALSAEGHRVFMVGDGLNDAPALSAAHVSMAPATAADIGRNAADFVFLRDSLSVVPLAIDVSRRAGRLIRENLALAVIYNAIAVPIAILGYVTPLIAAIAMSTSSLLVISNALRLLKSTKEPRQTAMVDGKTPIGMRTAGAQ